MHQLQQRGRELEVEPGPLLVDIPRLLNRICPVARLLPLAVVAVLRGGQPEAPRRALVNLLHAVRRRLDNRLGRRVRELEPPRDFFTPEGIRAAAAAGR